VSRAGLPFLAGAGPRRPATAIAFVCAGTLLLAACSRGGDAGPVGATGAAPVATPSAATAAVRPAGDDPCRLLTDAEVRRSFPGARAGQPETSREKYGIRACVWQTERGSFALQRWTAKAGTVDNEIRGLSLGFVDPLNPAARQAVRFEPLSGIGEQAMAVVETRDDARGILTDVAMLVTQRGDQLIELHSQDLARGDRAAALQTLSALARSAASRL